MAHGRNKPRILVVDDSRTSRLALLKMLSSVGDFSTVEAENGVKALEILTRQNDIELVLLDIEMPFKSGIDVLKEYVEAKNFFQPSIIVTSAIDDSEIIAEAIDLGAADYLVKPINKRLMAAV
ncbi:MAG: response regulator, partial [Sphaerospermopsis sp. SIO1G2]|nr:response regulator [Sphaerospermopsis sp. SIO1G2]